MSHLLERANNIIASQAQQIARTEEKEKVIPISLLPDIINAIPIRSRQSIKTRKSKPREQKSIVHKTMAELEKQATKAAKEEAPTPEPKSEPRSSKKKGGYVSREELEELIKEQKATRDIVVTLASSYEKKERDEKERRKIKKEVREKDGSRAPRSTGSNGSESSKSSNPEYDKYLASIGL
jgi:hypothetical protein